MGGVSYAEVCAAVSEAGGFGSLGMAGLVARGGMRQQMRRVRELTDKPFGVDLLTAQPETLTASVDVIIEEGAKEFIAGLGVPVAIIEAASSGGHRRHVHGGVGAPRGQGGGSGCDVCHRAGDRGGRAYRLGREASRCGPRWSTRSTCR